VARREKQIVPFCLPWNLEFPEGHLQQMFKVKRSLEDKSGMTSDSSLSESIHQESLFQPHFGNHGHPLLSLEYRASSEDKGSAWLVPGIGIWDRV
jgi:hypothetical protein